jgi:hypothetical protein
MEKASVRVTGAAAGEEDGRPVFWAVTTKRTDDGGHETYRFRSDEAARGHVEEYEAATPEALREVRVELDRARFRVRQWVKGRPYCYGGPRKYEMLYGLVRCYDDYGMVLVEWAGRGAEGVGATLMREEELEEAF